VLGFRCRRFVLGKMGGGTPPGATRPNLRCAAADAAVRRGFLLPQSGSNCLREFVQTGEKQSGFPVFGPAWRSLPPPAAHAGFPTRTLGAVGLRVRRRLNRYSPQASQYCGGRDRSSRNIGSVSARRGIRFCARVRVEPMMPLARCLKRRPSRRAAPIAFALGIVLWMTRLYGEGGTNEIKA